MKKFSKAAVKRVFTALRDDDSQYVRNALSEGLSPDAVDPEMERPLLLESISHYDYELAKDILALGAKVSCSDSYGQTPLHISVKEKEGLEVTKLLIDAGANVNAQDCNGCTPIVDCKNSELVDILIAAGADINLKINKSETLYSKSNAVVRSRLQEHGIKGIEGAGGRVIEAIVTHDPDLSEVHRIKSIGKSNDGNIWLSSYDGYHCFAKNGIVRYQFEDSFSPGSFASGKNGAIYFATNWGLLEFKSDVWKLYEPENSELHEGHLVEVINDLQGNIYCRAYDEFSISVFDGNNWRLIKPDAYLLNRADEQFFDINCMACTTDGNLLLGSDKGALIHDGEKWRAFRLNDESVSDLEENTIYDMLVDDSVIYLACSGGVLRYQDNHMQHIRPKGTNLIKAITVGNNEEVWACGSGLICLHGEQYERFTEEQYPLLNESPKGLVMADDAVLWFYSDRVLMTLQDGEICKIAGISGAEIQAKYEAEKARNKRNPLPKKAFISSELLPKELNELLEEVACDNLKLTALQKLIRPAIGLWLNKKVGKKDLEIGVSKFGGLPDLPEKTKWPMNPEDKSEPLPFLMQIQLEDVHEYDLVNELPSDGLLSFFCDTSADEIQGARVIYTPKTENLSRLEMPDDLAVRIGEEDYTAKLPELPLSYFPFFTAPSCEYFDEHAKLTEEELDNLSELPEKLRNLVKQPEGEFWSHLLGWADTIQGDVMDNKDTLLLQLFPAGQKQIASEVESWCYDSLVHFVAKTTQVSKQNFKKVVAEMVYT